MNENKNKEEQRIRREFVLFVSQDTRIDLHAWLIGRKKGGEGGGERRKIENKRRQIRGWRVPENFHSMALRSLVIFFFFFFLTWFSRWPTFVRVVIKWNQDNKKAWKKGGSNGTTSVFLIIYNLGGGVGGAVTIYI